MLIINADDWGAARAETDAALNCFRKGRITSVTAMMFMEDSERAAELAKEYGVETGLHLNLDQPYNGRAPLAARDSLDRVATFLKRSKFAVLLYHPGLRSQFRELFRSQLEEFVRLYGKPPTHVDGHHHRHLCANMLFDGIIPRGFKVRRNFSFWPDEKGVINRVYRSAADSLLRRRCQITDFFFSLGDCLRNHSLERVLSLAATANVELMTHPNLAEESSFLLSEECDKVLKKLRVASYAAL
jgi:chitin disaccharide deacetylase